MKQLIKNEDLKNVNGGLAIKDGEAHCPHCNQISYNVTQTSTGCNPTYHYKCDDCGYEWDK